MKGWKTIGGRSVVLVTAMLSFSSIAACGQDLPGWLRKSAPDHAKRLMEVMERAGKGESVTIGVIGGSITEGAFATGPSMSYGGRIQRWWQQQFPSARIGLVNAGVGATTSVYGVHRIDGDLLARKPDVIIMEFAVNDFGVREAAEAYEGMVRKALKHNPAVALLSLALMDSTGSNCQHMHRPVCDHYGIPMVSYRDAIWPQLLSGKLTWKSLSPDQVHPNDEGHGLIASLVTGYFGRLWDEREALSTGSSDQLPAPFTANRFESASVILPGSLEPIQWGNWRFLPESGAWVASEKGEPMIVEVDARELRLMYRRKIGGKGANGYVVVDGKATVRLDGDFADGWGDYTDVVALGSAKEVHRFTLAFYLDDQQDRGTLEIKNLLVVQ